MQFGWGGELSLDLHELLDRSPRAAFVYRDYELNRFRVNQSFASCEDVTAVGYGIVERIRARLLQRPAKWQHRYFERIPDRFQTELLTLSNSCYLDGYWQDIRYFDAIQDTIKCEFQLWQTPVGAAKDLLLEVQQRNSVCVNVRRTDFVGCTVMGTCSIDYYRKASERIASKTKNPFFYVFSDDLDWCEENLKFLKPHCFVRHSVVSGQMEWYLEIMKHCRHFIIPNSTFAWWAAFLAPAAETIVAPLRWFQDAGSRDAERSIVPDSWLRL